MLGKFHIFSCLVVSCSIHFLIRNDERMMRKLALNHANISDNKLFSADNSGSG